MKINNVNLFLSCVVSLSLMTGCSHAKRVNENAYHQEKTVFQTSREWRPTIDNRGDVAIIYGVGGNPSDKSRRVPFEERVKSWQERGYQTHFMTGIAWGEYQDYFTGEWDGKWHLDEGPSGMDIWYPISSPRKISLPISRRNM